MARFTIEPIKNHHIPQLSAYEKAAFESEIAMNIKTDEEWRYQIKTYEHSRIMLDTEKDFIFGYHLTAQIENNLWIREIFIHPKYRSTERGTHDTKREGYGGIRNKPIATLVKTAADLGGDVFAPIATSNIAADNALKVLYGFINGPVIEGWFPNGKDMLILHLPYNLNPFVKHTVPTV
tara:strand:+ start:2006 stop:2542 length:537 start_codon:yes stop_codon:yes gene_type:complete